MMKPYNWMPGDGITGTIVGFRLEDVRITDEMMKGRRLVCHVDYPDVAIGLLDKIEDGLVHVIAMLVGTELCP